MSFSFLNTTTTSRVFNRERVILSAMQTPNQLYEMLDTHHDGLYLDQVDERRREYGQNIIRLSRLRFLNRYTLDKKADLDEMLEDMDQQKTTVHYKDNNQKNYTEITKNLVPGDVLTLTAGDIVPADVRIVEDHELSVNQYFLTDDKSILPKKAFLDDTDNVTMVSVTRLPNICFMGSIIVEGAARAVVIGTGENTYLSDKLH